MESRVTRSDSSFSCQYRSSIKSTAFADGWTYWRGGRTTGSTAYYSWLIASNPNKLLAYCLLWATQLSNLGGRKCDLRREHLAWLTGAMLCLLVATGLQLSVSVPDKWPHNALRQGCTIKSSFSCQYRGCIKSTAGYQSRKAAVTTTIRLHFDRATTIRRHSLRPHALWSKFNKLCGRPPQYATRPYRLTFDLPWKWCPSHMWCGLPLCQFQSSLASLFST